MITTPTPKRSLEEILDGLKADGNAIIVQLKSASNSVYADFLNQLGGDIVLTDAQKDDIAWASTALTSSAILTFGADVQMLADLGQARLEALSILSNIEAIKAKNGEELFKNVVSKATGVIQQFILQGESVLIAGALAAI